jgi:mono/diheme cytochrome c family protein
MKVRYVSVVLLVISGAWAGAVRQDPLRPGEKSTVDDPAAIAAGAALYARSCASCHSIESRAPSLATGVFAHGGEDDQIAQTIRAGVPGTQMPAFPALRPEAVLQLVAYIRSLSNAGSPSAASGAGDAAAGQQIFDGKPAASPATSQCSWRRVGPDLQRSAALDRQRRCGGRLSARTIPSGRARRTAAPVVIVAKTRDGRDSGVRRSEDTFSVMDGRASCTCSTSGAQLSATRIDADAGRLRHHAVGERAERPGRLPAPAAGP